MGRPLNIKRKDGLGYWPLWCLSEEEYYDLTDGGDCYIHKHDQMYFTETELLNGALDERYYTETELLNGALDSRYYTETEIDAIVAALDHGDLNGLDDPADHTWALLVDGSRPLTGDWDAGSTYKLIIDTILAKTGAGLLLGDTDQSHYVQVANAGTTIGGGGALRSYVTTYVYGGEGAAGSLYIMADQADDNDDRWGILAQIDGRLTIESYATGAWVELLELTAAGLLSLNGTVGVDSILDQDDFYSDSDTALATQQSIKKYVDDEILGIDLSAYLKHDGSVELSADWDIGASRIIQADTVRSRLAVDSGLTLANRNGTGYIYVKDGNQYVGINRVDPDAALDVYTPTASIAAQFESGTANAFIEFLDNSTGSNKVYLGAIGDDLVLFGDGTSAMRFTTSGVLDVANSAAVLDEDAMGSDSATKLATQQSIKAYSDNKDFIDHGSILTSNGTYTGQKLTVTVDDVSAAFGKVLAQAADFNYDLADADAAANSVGLVMALESGTGSKEVLIEGQVCNTAWNWSAGLLYLSTTAGDMTQTAPSGTGDQVVSVGWALSADTIYFKPSLVLVEVA